MKPWKDSWSIGFSYTPKRRTLGKFLASSVVYERRLRPERLRNLVSDLKFEESHISGNIIHCAKYYTIPALGDLTLVSNIPQQKALHVISADKQKGMFKIRWSVYIAKTMVNASCSCSVWFIISTTAMFWQQSMTMHLRVHETSR